MRTFSITTVSDKVQVDSQHSASVLFTVTNTSGRTVTGRAILETIPQGASHITWLRLQGETERRFNLGELEDFTVEVSVPVTAKPGEYAFRLNMFDVSNPDENYTEGPTVTVIVEIVEPIQKRKIPWWVWWIIGGVGLIIIIVAIYLLLLR